MTTQTNTSESFRRLPGDTMDLLARDLGCRREKVFTVVISDGHGNFRLLISEHAEFERAPRKQRKPTILENVAHTILEIATLQKQAIAEHKQLSRYTISPMSDAQQSERHCEEEIDPTTGDIYHQDSRAKRR